MAVVIFGRTFFRPFLCEQKRANKKNNLGEAPRGPSPTSANHTPVVSGLCGRGFRMTVLLGVGLIITLGLLHVIHKFYLPGLNTQVDQMEQ